MAVPTIPTAAANTLLFSVTSAAGTTHTFPSLTTLDNANTDLLIAVIALYQASGTANAFSSWGGSFSEFGDNASTDNPSVALGCAYKISNGTETGTFTVTSSISGRAAMALMSVKDWHGTTPPEVAFSAHSATTAPDPPNLDPTNWAAEDTLWIAVAGAGQTSLTGSWTGLGSAPANYGNYGESAIAGGDVVGAAQIAVAFRGLNASAENPGAFTTDTSPEIERAATIAVRPAFVQVYKDGSGSATSSSTASATGLRVRPGSGSATSTSTASATGLLAGAIHTLRPVSDGTDLAKWTEVPTGSAWSTLDDDPDSPDTNDYVETSSTNTADVNRSNFQTLTLRQNEQTKTLTLKSLVRLGTGGSTPPNGPFVRMGSTNRTNYYIGSGTATNEQGFTGATPTLISHTFTGVIPQNELNTLWAEALPTGSAPSTPHRLYAWEIVVETEFATFKDGSGSATSTSSASATASAKREGSGSATSASTASATAGAKRHGIGSATSTSAASATAIRVAVSINFTAPAWSISSATATGMAIYYRSASATAVSSASATGEIKDTTPPSVNITAGPSKTRISRISGQDVTTFTIQADDDFVEYKLKVVPDANSPHTAGTLLETSIWEYADGNYGDGKYGAGFVSGTSYNLDVTDDELVDAGISEGTYVVKAFIKDASENWST